jgi:hypothetical protein
LNRDGHRGLNYKKLTVEIGNFFARNYRKRSEMELQIVSFPRAARFHEAAERGRKYFNRGGGSTGTAIRG